MSHSLTRLLLGTAACLGSASMSFAGGLDRNHAGVDILFEEGGRLEFSLGNVNPSVTGTYTHPLAGTLQSGSVAPSYTTVSGAVKFDVNEKIAIALIIDEPWGADVSYPLTGGFSAVAGANATLNSRQITGIAKYQINDNMSAYGGLRAEAVDMNVAIPGGGALQYSATGARDTAFGYLFGAAYERKDIALRVALTYASEIDHSVDTSERSIATGGMSIASVNSFTMPQSVTLDFQSGVAANTLVFGSIKWTDWTETTIYTDHYKTALGQGNLVDHDDDVITYELGVGRRFNDQWSAAVTLGYEKTQGTSAADPASNLSPTDGYKSIGVGATYSMENSDISFGVRYVDIGNATSSGAGGLNGKFSDNSAVAVGIKFGYSF